MQDHYGFNSMINQLDASYAELMKTAELYRHAFFIEAKECLGEQRKHVPIVIHIHKSPGNSSSICWARMLAKKGDGITKTKPFPRRIAKGTGRGRKTYSYPASCFQFLEPELRHLVLHYDKFLSVIREQASKLLQQRKEIVKLLEMEANGAEFYKNRLSLVTLSNPTASSV